MHNNAKGKNVNTEVVDLKPCTISVKISDINVKRIELREIVTANLVVDSSERKEKKEAGRGK